MELKQVEDALLDYRTPIHPCEPLRGGRTEGFWMLKSVGGIGEHLEKSDSFFKTHPIFCAREIKFEDVVSLYPSVMLQNAFVASHPAIY